MHREAGEGDAVKQQSVPKVNKPVDRRIGEVFPAICSVGSGVKGKPGYLHIAPADRRAGECLLDEKEAVRLIHFLQSYVRWARRYR
jgi:hypothetical protein